MKINKPIKKRPFLITQNNGPELVFTNFWDAEPELKHCAFSVNAGAIRLLVPECKRSWLPAMVGCEYVIASRLKTIRPKEVAIEFLFEDHSQTPFSIHTSPEAFLGVFPIADSDTIERKLTIWTQGPNKVAELPLFIRNVPRLPWMKPIAR